jgi:hypothetical protein
MTPKQTAAVDRAPMNSKVLLERVFNGDASPREAIKAKCQECMGYNDVANAVRNCSSQACPLLAYRPYLAVRMPEGADLTG